MARSSGTKNNRRAVIGRRILLTRVSGNLQHQIRIRSVHAALQGSEHVYLESGPGRASEVEIP